MSQQAFIHQASHKAIILASGERREMYPLTEALPLELLPLGNQPLLGRVFQELRDAGITQALLISHAGNRCLEEYAYRAWPLLHLTRQREPGSLMEALQLARSFVGDQAFLLTFPHIVFRSVQGPPPLQRLISLTRPPGCAAMLSVGVRSGVGDALESGELSTGRHEDAGAGRYVFDPSIFDVLARDVESSVGSALFRMSIKDILKAAGGPPVVETLRPGEECITINSLRAYRDAFNRFWSEDAGAEEGFLQQEGRRSG